MADDASSSRRHLSPAQWQALFDQFAAGNENVRAFCRRHGVSPSRFYYWRRKLTEPPTAAAPSPGAEASTPGFIEAGALTEAPMTAAWDIELALGDGVVLRLRRG